MDIRPLKYAVLRQSRRKPRFALAIPLHFLPGEGGFYRLKKSLTARNIEDGSTPVAGNKEDVTLLQTKGGSAALPGGLRLVSLSETHLRDQLKTFQDLGTLHFMRPVSSSAA